MDPPIDQQEAHSETALEASVKDKKKRDFSQFQEYIGEAVYEDMDMDVDETILEVHGNEKQTFNEREKTPFGIFEDATRDAEPQDGNDNDNRETPVDPQRTLTTSMSEPSLANIASGLVRDDATTHSTNNTSMDSPSRDRHPPPSSKPSTPHKRKSTNTTPSSNHRRSFSLTNFPPIPIPPLRILGHQKFQSPYLGPVGWTVPKKGSSSPSKPFLIYQDPAWYEPQSPIIDEAGYVAASDDKENAHPTQQQIETTTTATTTTTTTASDEGGGDESDSTASYTVDNAVAAADNIVELASRASATPLRGYTTFFGQGPDEQESELALSASIVGGAVARGRTRGFLRRSRGHGDLRALAFAGGNEEEEEE